MTAYDLGARKKRVPSDFDRLAGSYDLLARLNPGYAKHLRWSAERMALAPQARILDVCCGTGLSTEALARVYPDASIVALDGSPGMLAVARGKSFAANVRIVQGDAMAPGAAVEGAFDAILMAYGIRNVPDPDGCLAELRRLLVPGGVACFHEYSVADSLRARLVWDAVALGIIVPLGVVLSREAEIYRYLWRSVRAFDGVSAFRRRLQRAGFENVRVETMDGWQRDIVHSFIARRPRL